MHKTPNTHWIWIPNSQELVDGKARLVRFRKRLHLDAVPEHLEIKISADTRYKLYVNSQFVEYGPARGDQRIWFVDNVDIAPWLHVGENVVAVEVLRYPLSYRSGNFGMVRTAIAGLFVDGGIYADESWKCREVSGFQIVRESPGFAPMMILEDFTAEAQDSGWKTDDYDDSGWENALPYTVFQISEAACPGDLSPRPIPYMIKVPGRFKGVVPKYDATTADKWNALLAGKGSVTVPAGQNVTVELNAGEEMCGFLSLRFIGGKGATVKILTSEGYVQNRLYKNTRSPVKGDRCDWVNGHLDGFTDVYHAAGYGTQEAPEVYEPFWFRTFRFVALEIQTGDECLTIADFDYAETGYPLNVKTTASASDSSFDGIWDISLRSLRRCMQETYIDCPFYEQLQYAMDSRNEILYTYTTSADDRLARQCMEAFRLSQRADGMINCCYPHWGPNIIPGFSIYYILMVYDHMMYFGDKKLIKHHLGAIDGILEYFDNHLESRGLVGKTGGHITERYWSFIDWSVPWGNTVGTPPSGLNGPIVMESLLYVYGLQHAAKLCDYVGRSGTAEEYRNRAEAVQNAINTHCRDEEGFYLDSPGVKDYSQHCQVFAILTNTVPSDEGKKLLLATLDNEEKFAQCTVASLFYVFRALEAVNAYDRTEALWEPWRNMLKDNLTTCVENPLEGRSDCHAWGSLLLYELPAVILGIQPGSPGYQTVRIAPNPAYLKWAKGDAITPWGKIKVQWSKDDSGELNLQYDVPKELEGKVEIKL